MARTALFGKDTPKYPDSAVAGQSPCRTLDSGVLGKHFGPQWSDVDMVRGPPLVNRNSPSGASFGSVAGGGPRFDGPRDLPHRTVKSED